MVPLCGTCWRKHRVSPRGDQTMLRQKPEWCAVSYLKPHMLGQFGPPRGGKRRSGVPGPQGGISFPTSPHLPGPAKAGAGNSAASRCHPFDHNRRCTHRHRNRLFDHPRCPSGTLGAPITAEHEAHTLDEGSAGGRVHPARAPDHPNPITLIMPRLLPSPKGQRPTAANRTRFAPVSHTPRRPRGCAVRGGVVSCW